MVNSDTLEDAYLMASKIKKFRARGKSKYQNKMKYAL